MKHYAIILASGTGSRCGLNIPKQFYKIEGKTVLEYSIEAFENHNSIDGMILVSNPDFIKKTQEILSKNNYRKIIKLISGGKTRQESAYEGLSVINEKNVNVLIHDAVRPFVTKDIIDRCINALQTHKAVNIAVESSDTIIEIDKNNIMKQVPDRKFLRRCQTPQGFNINVIKKAHELAHNDKSFAATDDCGLVLRYNLADIFVIKGSNSNIKITYPTDIKLAKEIVTTIKKGI